VFPDLLAQRPPEQWSRHQRNGSLFSATITLNLSEHLKHVKRTIVMSNASNATQRQRLVRSTNQRTIQGFFDACERAKQHVSEFHSTFPTFSGMFSVSYLPHNGPVSVRHSQQRDRARMATICTFPLFTRLSAAPSIPGIFGTNWRADDVSLACFLRTAQRATCGGGCASISVRWHSRERESYRIAQCFSEGEGLARDGQIAPEFHTVPGWRELLAPRCAL
jgi:hypothetical protein